MGTIFVKIPDEVEKKMRRQIFEQRANGKIKKGDLSDFVTKAIKSYLKTFSQTK
ncbi:MAG: hypothetical protein ACTSRA_00040 [Promethearchaeota archaeon]|nr:MAG: hypothetical protein [Helarchaeota virus Nidhogg Meg22_1012]